MLEIRNIDHFKEVVKFAKENNIWPKLRDQLKWLSRGGEPNPPRWKLVRLFKDFAPNSFEFDSTNNLGPFKGCGMSGGLIFYAGAESGIAGPQFSVTTSGRKDSRWEINT